MPKTHPESLKEIGAVKVSDEIREFVTSLASEVEEERNNRRLWEQRIDIYRDLRYGYRAEKNHPWPECANYVIPLIDADIQRMKPAYINLAYSVNPIVTFEPYGPEDVEPARLREELFDWRMRTKVKFFPQYCLGVDRLLEQGQVIFKIMWKFQTRTYEERFDLDDMEEEVLEALYDPRLEDSDIFNIIVEELNIDLEHEENIDSIEKAIKDFRSGETDIRIDLVETVHDQPEVVACDLRNDLTVPTDTLDLNDARFIDYVYPMSVNDIKTAMKDGKFEEYTETDIESWAGKRPDERNIARRIREPNDIVWMHETCVWRDVNNDGIKERCITTWPDASPSSVLRFIEMPYDHGMWPYVQVKRELIDSGFYASRGVPELDADFQMAISTFTNQIVDNGTITNTPRVKYRQNSLVNPRNIHYIPGEPIEMKGSLDDYQVEQGANVSQGHLLQMAQYMKTWADQRLGNQTSGLGNEANLPGSSPGGKKTKAEIDLIQSLAVQTQSLDLQVFQQQMAWVYYQIDALYDQFGDEEETFIVTGQQPRKVSRREIQGKFNVVPNGRLDNSDPARRLNKTMLALRLGMESPIVKQDSLMRLAFENIDSRMADLVVKSEEELAIEAKQQQLAIERAKLQQANEQIAMKKAVDDTDIRKEFLLEPITGAKFKAD